MLDGQFGLKAWKQHITSMPSQWSAIANPHCKGFDPQHPKVPPLGHDPGNRMKIWIDIIYEPQSVKTSLNDEVVKI